VNTVPVPYLQMVDYLLDLFKNNFVISLKTERYRIFSIGEKHGTITARINDAVNFEVTTLRIDKVPVPIAIRSARTYEILQCMVW
jgi:tRNA nucleotidyltransferase/poly(A) polymerase